MKKNVKEQVARLAAEIKLHRYLYYNKEPRITDQAYDALAEQLKQLDPDNDVLKQVGAPPPEDSGWQKVQHTISMASLANAMSIPEFEKWAQSNQVQGKVCVLEDKFDGNSVELNYVDGQLVQASTRGDGMVGEDITINVKRMKFVKPVLREKVTASIRGETMMFKKDFDALNLVVDKKFSNPRNAANGIAKRFDGKYSEFVYIIVYDIISSDVTFSYETEKLDYLSNTLELLTTNYKLVTPAEVIRIRQQYMDSEREKLPYNIDGLVVKINNIARQKELGLHPNGDPKGQVAFKFDARGVATVMNGYSWEVGRTGVITPNAVFDPVNIDGSMVEHATLHNIDEINRLGVGVGDTVLVVKAGEIIPKVLQVIKSLGKGVPVPTTCPACDGPVVRDGAFLWCDSDNCVGKEFRRLRHWVDVMKKRMSLSDIGESTIEQLYEKGFIKDPADFYQLSMQKVASLDRSGEKSAKKIINGFAKCKELDIVTLLCALAIPTLGETMAESIADEYDLYALMEEVGEDDLMKIPNIGPSRAKDIVQGLEERRPLIEKLMAIGVKVKKMESVKLESNKLQGKSFQVTGPITRTNPATKKSYKREEWYEFVMSHGGEIKRVGKGLDYLLVCRSAGNKISKAGALGIKMISEADFWKMVDE